MADKILASQVDGGVRKAKNGRDYVKLKKGGSRMLSKEDATRLRADLRGKSTPKPKPKSNPKPRKSGGSSKKKDDKPKSRRTKKFLGDFL